MKRPGHTWLLLTGVLFLAALPSPAQPVAVAPPLPSVPTLKSPVDRFRELLALSPMERRRSLTNRPIDLQRRTLAKLREYDALSPNERQLRLQATELRWYLRPLMELSPTNRAA